MKSTILVFKTGYSVSVPYSNKIFTELSENLGKDHKVEAKTYTVNCKELVAVIFQVSEESTAEEE